MIRGTAYYACPFVITHHQDCCSEPSVASSTVVGKVLILRASYEPSPAADHAASAVPLVPLFTVSRDCATLINLGQQFQWKDSNSEFSQRLRFKFVWVASSSWLRLSAGRTAHALPPSGPDVAAHLAAIIRVPPRVASSVTPALDRLHQHSPHHHYYPPETMHVTV